MNICVIGAGFSGLAASYFLSKKGCDVSLFDSEGIGGGASGIASGLLHPYPEMDGNKSWRADDAMQSTLRLLDVAETEMGRKVAARGGILRTLLKERTRSHMQGHPEKFDDIEWVSKPDILLIQSGVTVFPSLYLNGLWSACERLGAKFEKRRIASMASLSGFDHVVIAAGGGIRVFDECKSLPINVNKGHILRCKAKMPFERSWIGNGYLAVTEDPSEVILGSTYEHDFETERSDMAYAKEAILSKVSAFLPSQSLGDVLECKCGVRVARKGSRLPLIGEIEKGIWVMTAMGSRGLLYHAFSAEMLALAMIDRKHIPDEVKIT